MAIQGEKLEIRAEESTASLPPAEVPVAVPQPSVRVDCPPGRGLVATGPSAVLGREQGLRLAAVCGLLGATFLWSYWSTLAGLVDIWNRVPDYSHGFLVAPLAVFFLWARRDRMPAVAAGLAWQGLVLVAVSAAMRLAGAWYYFEWLDGWSILLWIAGVIWLFLGRAFVWWSLPSVVFLMFMVRLPFKAELALSLPLQTVATHLSCWVLQILGQPALAEGHTIHLGEHTLEVEQACSGLRIFMGIAALAYAYVVIVRRSWWEKAILLAERGSDCLDCQRHAGSGHRTAIPVLFG